MSTIIIPGTATDSSSSTFTNKTFDANDTGNSLSNVEVADFASSAITGLDSTVVTGTSGTSGYLLQWNDDGDAVGTTIAATDVVTSPTTVHFTIITMASDDSDISVGSAVSLDTQEGTTTYTNDGNTTTLPSGGQFLLEAFVGANNNASYSEFRWYDVTNTAYLGTKMGCYAPNYSNGTAASTNAVAYVNTTGGAVDVELRCEAKGATTDVKSAHTKAIITQIA